jgi:phenylacetyl-CoA:acceptor oxidoreductase subunit 2
MNVEPTHQTPWDWRAAIQFICGGTGTGLLLLTALVAWQEPAWLTRTGLVALAFIALGLFSVWIKLGRRLRFLFVFLNPRTSWMSREALLSLPLGVLALLAIVLGSAALALVASLFGLGFLYAQARMLQAAQGIPAWRERLTTPLIVATGLAEGTSLMLAAAVVLEAAGTELVPPTWLPALLFLLLLARLGVWLAYRRKLSRPGAAPDATVAVLNGIDQPLVYAGHGAPILLLAVAFFVPQAAALAWLAAAVLALVGGWFLKFTLIARAAYNQGFALTHAPARAPGFGGPGAKPGWS